MTFFFFFFWFCKTKSTKKYDFWGSNNSVDVKHQKLKNHNWKFNQLACNYKVYQILFNTPFSKTNSPSSNFWDYTFQRKVCLVEEIG